MKNFSVIHILLFLLLLLVYQCANAQDYVVLLKGDTVYGAVKPMLGPEKKVQVVSADKKKNNYPILQVKGYRYKDEMYQTVRDAKGYTFMKVIKSGYLSLYAFQLENQTGFDGLFLTKKDGTFLEVPNLTFKKMVLKFLEECPEITAKIEGGELGKRDINAIVDGYNACIESRTQKNNTIVAQQQEQVKKVNSWDVLEEKIKAKNEFEGKSDALEMITEIKGKILRSEKVPNFMIEGLKNSLAATDLGEELQQALNDLTK